MKIDFLRWPSRLAALALVVLGMGFASADGARADVRFDNPRINGAIVDWCRTWATDCGKGGADHYCVRRGYSHASYWATFHPGRTWVMGSNQFCNGGFCQGFSVVVCAGQTNPGFNQRTFHYPQLQGASVDWCATWATNCGKGGADQYCQRVGYQQATSWQTYRPGRTWVIGSNQYCNGGFCVGLSQVTCVGQGGVQPPYTPPGQQQSFTFNYPQIAGRAVDWCVTWATNCGWGGANQFCQRQGYTRALSWQTYKPGTTYVVGSNQVCNGAYCTAFSQVACTR